jgi:hypothetical protein
MAKKNGPEAGPAGGEAPDRPATKREAVERALASLGRDAKPKRIQVFVKERFGIDMSPDHISNYKSDIRRRKGKKRKGKGGRPAAAPTAPAAGPRTAPGAIPLADIDLAKGLVERLGAKRLHALIDVLAR